MKFHLSTLLLLCFCIATNAQNKKVQGEYSEGLAWVKKRNKYGFQNKKGKPVIPYKYDSVLSFTEGLAAVKIDTNWFYINKHDSPVHSRLRWVPDSIKNKTPDIQYWKEARPFYNGIAVVKNFWEDSPYNAIGLGGYWALGDFGADSLGDFINDYTEVVYGKHHGIIGINEDELVPAKYEDVDSFSNGWVKAKLNGKWMLLNPYGECVQNCIVGERTPRKYISSYHTLYFPNVAVDELFDEITKFKLAALINFMKRHPKQRMVIAANGNSSYISMQRSWDYMFATVNYILEHSDIKRGQFIMNYGQNGMYRTVNIRKAKPEEDGSINPPPPFPNLSIYEK